VPDLPGRLLAEGAYAKDIGILTGHQANEAPGFTPPYVQTNEQLADFIQLSFPDIEQEVTDYIVNDLYPDVYDGTYGYRSALERTFLVVSDSIFTCNTNYLNKAYNNKTFAYEFQVPPALHGQDVAYTFYNGQNPQVIGEIAKVQQGYIVNFALTGDPNGAGLPIFPMQGANASMNSWNSTAVKTERDPTVNERCAWWQQGLYAT
jgi:carboxylesterase type B